MFFFFHKLVFIQCCVCPMSIKATHTLSYHHSFVIWKRENTESSEEIDKHVVG